MERIRENLIKESLMNIRFLAQSEYFNGIHIKDDIILEKEYEQIKSSLGKSLLQKEKK